MECAMTNPDKMRLQEIPFQGCLSAAVFNLYIQFCVCDPECFAPGLPPRVSVFYTPALPASPSATRVEAELENAKQKGPWSKM